MRRDQIPAIESLIVHLRARWHLMNNIRLLQGTLADMDSKTDALLELAMEEIRHADEQQPAGPVAERAAAIRRYDPIRD